MEITDIYFVLKEGGQRIGMHPVLTGEVDKV